MDEFKRQMQELEDFFSKLNPMAREFVPTSLAAASEGSLGYVGGGGRGAMSAGDSDRFGHDNGAGGPRARNNGHDKGKGKTRKRVNCRTSVAQREEIIRRTVFVSDIDHQVTEQELAALFFQCGQIVDCRVCGDPRSVLRFAFVEFTDRAAAHAALSLSGMVLGYYPVKVNPSKTAIAPVNPTFLPQTAQEREMCSRTVYVTNIDKMVSQVSVKHFLETLCGEVYCIRLLGDNRHSSRIGFVEFAKAESAVAALNCSGLLLGSLPIRVSPSKTPVRSGASRLRRARYY